jgi:hypothetical protein
MPAAVSKVAPFSGLGEEHKRESCLRMRERWGLIGRISTSLDPTLKGNFGIRLQMSQVFPLPYIDDPMCLAFQGFYERDRATGKVAGFPHRLYTRTQTKTPDAAGSARGITRIFNPQQNRSRISEAASPNRCCSYTTLLTPKPHRSEARPR